MYHLLSSTIEGPQGTGTKTFPFRVRMLSTAKRSTKSSTGTSENRDHTRQTESVMCMFGPSQARLLPPGDINTRDNAATLLLNLAQETVARYFVSTFGRSCSIIEEDISPAGYRTTDSLCQLFAAPLQGNKNEKYKYTHSQHGGIFPSVKILSVFSSCATVCGP